MDILCFKGNLDNHNVLCEQFRMNYDITDKELIELLYYKLGKNLASLLEGRFAIVIKDYNKYLLIRDRMGFHSLYYSIYSDKVYFGFDLKTVVNNILPHPKIDESAVYHYLSFLALPEDITWFKNVKKVEPGTCVVIENGKVEKNKYYFVSRFINNVICIKLEDAEKKIRNIIYNVISQEQDGYTIALSGGVDSCLLAAVSSDLRKNFDTISVYINQNDEEMCRIKECIKHIQPKKIEFKSCLITEENIDRVAHWISQETFEPMQLLDMVLILTILENDEKKRYIFGEGADELGGYFEYIRANEINDLLNMRKRKGFYEKFKQKFGVS